jgi:hypothetical protein
LRSWQGATLTNTCGATPLDGVQLIMAQRIAKLWRALAKRSKSSSDGTRIIPQAVFRRMLARERVRADRNEAPLSILSIELPADRSRERDYEFLSQVLQRRLRITDSAGFAGEGRIAILLPDTSKAGAWKVASDICDLYPVGHKRPNCEVDIYPDTDSPSADEGARSRTQTADSTFAPLDSLFSVSTAPTLGVKQGPN